MSEFKFVPGNYLTRDGRKAVVLCDDAPGHWPLIGYIRTRSNSDYLTWEWLANGKRHDRGDTGPEDLIPPVQEQGEVVRWVTLWKDGDITVTEQPPVSGQRHVLAEARTRVVLTPGRFDIEDSPSEYDRGWNEALDKAAHDLEFRREHSGPDTNFCNTWLNGMAAAIAHVHAVKRRPS
jgi:hypothetical protein